MHDKVTVCGVSFIWNMKGGVVIRPFQTNDIEKSMFQPQTWWYWMLTPKHDLGMRIAVRGE